MVARIALVGALAMVLAGCQSAMRDRPPASGPLVLGNDLLGDACRGEPRTGVLPEPGLPRPLDLYCGSASRPVGGIVASALPIATAEPGEGRRAAIAAAAHAGPIWQDIVARMTCREGTWVPFAGTEALLQPCQLTEGGWPQVVVSAGLGETLFRAEGLPATVPVVEAAVRKLARAEPPPEDADADPAQRISQLEAVLGGEGVRFGSADFGRYGEIVQLARLYNSAKNFAGAESAYRSALELQTRALGATSAGVGVTLMELALQVSNQGRSDEAASLFQRAEPIVQRSTDPSDRARLYAYLAFDAANRARFADAQKLAQQATAQRREIVGSSSSPDDESGPSAGLVLARGELAHALITEAQMAARGDDVNSAAVSAAEALDIIGSTPGLPPWWRADALDVTGLVNARRGRLALAEKNLKDALQIRRRLYGESTPTALTYLELGRVYADQQIDREALTIFRAAFGILARDEVARSAIVFDKYLPFFEAASRVGEAQPDERPALEREMFRVMQLRSAGTADQTIARAAARLASVDPKVASLISDYQEAQRQRDAARLELANETAKPDDQRGSLRENALATEFAKASVGVDALGRQLRELFPAYFDFARPGVVDLAEFRETLREDEAAIALAFGRESAIALLVDRGRLQVRKLSVTDRDLADSVAELRRGVTPIAGALPIFNVREAQALYRKLLQPFERELEGVRHLVVVPSGPLASLPLGLLITKSSNDVAYVGQAWLARRMALTQVSSLKAFATLRTLPRRARAPEPFLGFGNPDFRGTATGRSGLQQLARECRDGSPLPPELLSALPPLPETGDELRRVAASVGAPANAVVTGRAATESALRSRPLDQYRVLYFATHGLLPGELRCQSEPGLALSSPERPPSSPSEDGLLDASEIAGLRLAADLVVLSACNTAVSAEELGGEALEGLSDSFFHAGVRAIVASHWSVPSASTTELMVTMFQKLGPNLQDGVAESLRSAQLAMMDRRPTSHPLFWAAFTVLGDGGGRGDVLAAEDRR